jgi:hypothetical protein
LAVDPRGLGGGGKLPLRRRLAGSPFAEIDEAGGGGDGE